MTEFILLGIENNRTRAYLQRLLHHGLKPDLVLLLSSNKLTPGQRKQDISAHLPIEEKYLDSVDNFSFYYNKPLADSLSEQSIQHKDLDTEDPNSKLVHDELKMAKQKLVVPSLPGGCILSKDTLSLGKKFLHVHPGIVPEYKGSTTIYYSMLRDSHIGASAIILSPEIDQGEIVATKKYPLPSDKTKIDYLHDPLIRSDLLIEVLKQKKLDSSPQPKAAAEPYYIIHPVLKHLAIMGADAKI